MEKSQVLHANQDEDEDVRSLVWFNKTAHPEAKLKFQWDVDYSLAFVEGKDISWVKEEMDKN